MLYPVYCRIERDSCFTCKLAGGTCDTAATVLGDATSVPQLLHFPSASVRQMRWSMSDGRTGTKVLCRESAPTALFIARRRSRRGALSVDG